MSKRPPWSPACETASDVLPAIDDLLKQTAALGWTRFGKTAGQLESLLDRLRHTPELSVRVPLALCSQEVVVPGRDGLAEAQLMRPCRIEHVVLAPECADFYWQLFVGTNLQGVDVAPFPARPFIVRGDDDDRISSVMMWNAQEEIAPGIKVRISAHNRGKTPARFESIVWVRVGSY